MSNKKTVVILQSCYIPWKGFFDLMDRSDEFILFDDVQFTRRDWRNRNVIKTPTGETWLTIPVNQKGNYFQSINETKVTDNKWASKHWKSISFNYAKAPFFHDYKSVIEDLYNACEQEEYISQINYKFIVKIAELLGIKTNVTWSTDYLIDTDLKKTDRLLALCEKAQATDYLSGPSAKSYIENDLFAQKNINVHYIDYSAYKPYPQLFDGFIHSVSVLDVLFNMGPAAYSYIKPAAEVEEMSA
jgi:hypothetical protein